MTLQPRKKNATGDGLKIKIIVRGVQKFSKQKRAPHTHTHTRQVHHRKIIFVTNRENRK